MNAQLMVNQFHFLRPEWLLAIIPAVLLVIFFWQQKNSAANWQAAINPQLLNHLTDGGINKTSRWPWLLLLLTWIIAAIAMAGPSWKKLPQPIHKKQDALVIVLDLSLSMLAEDIKPSRLVRARHKILDILAQRDEGLTALIAYSGDAHIVSPLTDDNSTIANLMPALAPGMMPVFGSDPVAALKLAKQCFDNTGVSNGRILLITDSITQSDVDDINNLLGGGAYELSIMGVGTTDGAPIPAKSGFLKNNSGDIIVPQLQRSRLEQLAKQSNGRYSDISLNDNDMAFLLPKLTNQLEEHTVLTERQFDQWHDRGSLLALALLPLALLAFRRGWLLVLPLLILTQPQSGYAFEWQDLWQRPDQRAAEALKNGDAKTAANLFNHPQWKASASFQAGDYDSAAKQFAKADSANDHYNRGNALAKAGQLDQAIDAYNKALTKIPDMEDALFNKQLLEQLKQQQQDQQEQQSPDNDDKSDQQDQASKTQDQQQDRQQNQNDQQQADNQRQNNSSDNDQQTKQNQPRDDKEPESEQKSEQQKQASEQQAAEKDQANRQEQNQQQQAQAVAQDQQSQQQKQAMEQWLRQIPDDPSGLLRRKFNHQSKLRQQQGEIQREQPQW